MWITNDQCKNVRYGYSMYTSITFIAQASNFLYVKALTFFCNLKITYVSIFVVSINCSLLYSWWNGCKITRILILKGAFDIWNLLETPITIHACELAAIAARFLLQPEAHSIRIEWVDMSDLMDLSKHVNLVIQRETSWTWISFYFGTYHITCLHQSIFPQQRTG